MQKKMKKLCKQGFFSFMEGYYNRNQQLSKKNKIPKYLSANKQFIFLKNLRQRKQEKKN
jgi:hypothetical protein